MDEKHVDPLQIQNTKHSEQTNWPTHPISISTHPVVTQYRYQPCHYDSISTHPVGAMTNPGTSPSHPETLQVRWNVQRWRDGEPLGGSRCSLMMVSCTKTTHTFGMVLKPRSTCRASNVQKLSYMNVSAIRIIWCPQDYINMCKNMKT